MDLAFIFSFVRNFKKSIAEKNQKKVRRHKWSTKHRSCRSIVQRKSWESEFLKQALLVKSWICCKDATLAWSKDIRHWFKPQFLMENTWWGPNSFPNAWVQKGDNRIFSPTFGSCSRALFFRKHCSGHCSKVRPQLGDKFRKLVSLRSSWYCHWGMTGSK